MVKSIEQTHSPVHYTTLQLQQLQKSTAIQLTEKVLQQQLQEKQLLITDLQQAQSTLQHQLKEYQKRERLL